LSSGVDSSIRLWKRSDGRLARVVGELANGVSAMALAPDGQRLISGDTTGRVVLWNMVEHTPIPLSNTQPVHHLSRIEQIVALPDSLHFASRDRDGHVAIWDASAAQVGQKSLAPDLFIRQIDSATRPGPVSLAALDQEGTVHLFDDTFREVGSAKSESEDQTSRPVSIRLNRAGDRLAVGTRQGGVILRELPGGKILRTASVDQAPVFKLEFTNSGDLIAATGQHLFRIREDREDAETMGLVDAKPEALDVSDDGRWVAYCSSQGAQLLHRGSEGSWTAVEGIDALGSITSLTLSRDGRQVVTGTVDGSMRITTLPDGESRLLSASHRGRIDSLSVSNDARYLLEVTTVKRDAGVAMVWDLEESKEVRVIPGQWAAGAMLPDGSACALLQDPSLDPQSELAGRILLVDHRADPPRVLPVRFDPPSAFAKLQFDLLSVSPDGRLIAAATQLQSPHAFVWTAEEGKLVASISEREPGPFSVLRFSPDGKTLLTGSGTGVLKLWDIPGPEANDSREIKAPRSTLRLLARPGQNTALTACEFHPTNPKQIALTTIDGRVSLWTEGQPIDEELIDLS
ncbi:MAG TPA: WD40 repeat domain-containing protein, partial [Isosphaeraceae bacterium]|nr:WD40 repeat domain-containing protein [Isosphaeraceae bacterium]